MSFNNVISQSLQETDFKLFQSFIYDKSGIRLQDHKKALIENRLRKRLRELNIVDYRSYYEYLTSPQGTQQELPKFLDAITTNETYFFRHEPLWKFIMTAWLPKLSVSRPGGTITVWSAACSTGEEPYSLAMAIKETIPHYAKRVRILASDLSQEVLMTAKQGLYRPYAVSRMPKHLLTKYFTKTEHARTGEDRFLLSSEIMSMVQFRQHNLKNPAFIQNCDMILLRNVMIYFDGTTKSLVLNNAIKALTPDGYLCVGEAESLTNLVDGFIYVQPSIFKQCTPDDLKSSIPKSRLTSTRLSAIHAK